MRDHCDTPVVQNLPFNVDEMFSRKHFTRAANPTLKSRCRNDRQCGKLIVVRLVGFKAWHFSTCLSLLPDLPSLGLPSPLLATPPSSDVQRHVSRPTDATPPPALFMWQLWSRPRRGAPSRKEMRRKTKKSSKPSTPSCACLGRGAVPVLAK